MVADQAHNLELKVRFLLPLQMIKKYMKNFKTGDQISWVKKMACVPHPDGKTDWCGNVLPVLRDIIIHGRIISKGSDNTWYVRPKFAENLKSKICGERYYDIRIEEKDIMTYNGCKYEK